MSDQPLNDDADLEAKIRNYEDQLVQVKAALTINPSHEDLLSIRSDLKEIIKILKSRILSIDITEPTVGSSSEVQIGKTELKTEDERNPQAAHTDNLTTSIAHPTALIIVKGKVDNLIRIFKLDNEDEKGETIITAPAPGSSTGRTPENKEYIKPKPRKADKKIFKYMGKFLKVFGPLNVDELPNDLKKFIAEIPTRRKIQRWPVLITHRDFRGINDKQFRHWLNKEKTKIRHNKINIARVKQGLEPYTFERRKPRPNQTRVK